MTRVFKRKKAFALIEKQAVEIRRRVTSCANAVRRSSPEYLDNHVASLERLIADSNVAPWRRDEMRFVVKIYNDLRGCVNLVGEDAFQRDQKPVIDMVVALQ